MDQPRHQQETSTSQHQQNVHLHMHHVCTCQGIYPSSYYPVGYRAHVPQVMAYATPPPMARPYLQHYQYTQLNVGAGYTVPLSHVSPVGSVYGQQVQSDGGQGKERRERGEQESEGAVNEPPVGYEFGQITPPANELLIPDNPGSAQTTTENFVKFLEKSCLTAEQIAYRNRNRPCFRNIQNLCIRTRSEILKPCTTISNIHSQGIPWATKDFIYAFVRLTNCWHILKGYWENRDGCSLGKIEKELTPEFRACYVRWERETIALAAQLTRVFYNLDTNLNNPTPTANVHTANNLIPPQVNLLKSTVSENILKNTTWTDPLASTSSITILGNGATTVKNARGVLHLPVTTTVITETADQANQTCLGDFCGGSVKAENDTDEEAAQARVYMKPGSYSVPKKSNNFPTSSNNELPSNNNNSPRTIEFFDTAQNVNRVRETGKKTDQKVLRCDDITKITPIEALENEQFDVPAQLVHEWLISSRFSDYGENSNSPASPSDMSSFFMDSMFPRHDNLAHLQVNMDPFDRAAITLLQRDKATGKGLSGILSHSKSQQINGKIDVTSRAIRKGIEVKECQKRNRMSFYESKDGGLTLAGTAALEKVVADLNAIDFTCLVPANKDFMLSINMDSVIKKIRNKGYDFVSDAVRDILHGVRIATVFLDDESGKKIEAVLWELLDQDIPGYNLSEVKTESDFGNQFALTSPKYEGDGDH